MRGGVVVSALVRLLFVQASWNYDRMIGVGLAVAMEPLLRRLPEERRRAALARATRFFNAHPYLAGTAVGALARVEQEGVPGDTVERLRSALIPPLGSVGDRLIWAGALPATIGIGLVTAVRVSPVVGAVSFLAMYTVLHLLTRVWFLRAGWRRGLAVSQALTRSAVRRGLGVAGPAAGLAVGVALPVVAEWLSREFTLWAALSAALVAAVGIVLARWLLPALGSLRYGLLIVLAALLVGAVWR